MTTRLLIATLVLMVLCASVAYAELSLPSGSQCTENTYGGFCIGMDHGKWGMTSPMIRLFRREYNLMDGVGSMSEITSFDMTELPSSYHTTNLCAYQFDLANDLLAQAGYIGYAPSSDPWGRGWNYTYGAYKIPTTIHNGTYVCHASGTARFQMGQPPQEVGTLTLATDDAWGYVSISNLTISSTAICPLVWNGTAISIPYSLSDGYSLDSTNLELIIYPMGPNGLGDPIYDNPTAATISTTSTTYSGSLTWSGQTNQTGVSAPYGLYVYDIKASHHQNFVFPQSQDNPPVWPDWQDTTGLHIDNDCANWSFADGTGDVIDSDSRYDQADSLHTPLSVTVTSCTGPTNSGSSYTFSVN